MAAPVRATILPSGVQAVLAPPVLVRAVPVAAPYRWAASVLMPNRLHAVTLARMSPVVPCIDPPAHFPVGPCGRVIRGFLPAVYRKARRGWQIYPSGRNR